MEILKKLDNVLYAAVKWVSLMLFAAMILLSITQVVCRYILQISLSFTEELARFLFIWVTFLGTAMALKKDQHVKMDLLVQKFPVPAQKAIRFLVLSVSMITYVILIYYGIGVMRKTMRQTSAALGLPMSYIYLAVPVCGILLVLFGCTRMACHFAKSKEAAK